MLRATLLALACLLALVPFAAQANEDYPVPAGRFFGQAGGFAVTDEAGVPFWSEFQRLGGVSALGYPVSGRYEQDGFVHQAMQKAILQWRPQEKRALLTNVLDDLSKFGKDEWLQTVRSTPRPLPAQFDAGLKWEDAVKRRQALLDADEAIKKRYYSVDDPMTFYGLPTSAVQDMGNHLAVRLQRAVIQRWKVDVPWAKSGEVTIANGGDLAKEAGLLDKTAVVSSSPAVEGRAEKMPWSGWWWPADEGVKGPHLFDADGPLARFDPLARKRGLADTATREWELKNIRLFGGRYEWAGHCNGWAAAAILEPEPTKPKTIDGVTFSVADQKGLLAKWHFADSAEWIHGDPEKGVEPADFHRALVQWMGAGKRAFVVDVSNGGDQILNLPVYRFRLFYTADPADKAKTHVRATLWFLDYRVPPDFVGSKNWPDDGGKTYEYVLVGDRNNPTSGAWQGASATKELFARPQHIWYPNPTARNTARPLVSPQLDYKLIQAITAAAS